MKESQITCNTKGEINIDDNAKANGISIALVDEKSIPVARYEFDGKKVSNLIRQGTHQTVIAAYVTS